MRLEYSLTLQDFKAAVKLHRRQRFVRRIIPWIGPILLLIAFIGFVVFSISKNVDFAAQSMALAAGAIVLTIGLPISRSISTRKSFNRLFPFGNKERRSSIDIDGDRIIREHSGASEFKISWDAVFGFAQDEKVTMLYTNKDCFLFFPTHVMSSQQRAELNDLIARHVTKGQQC